MKTYFYLLYTTLILVFASTSLLAQQTLYGIITDELGEPVISANIKILQGDTYITGTVTDFDGKYSIQIDPGIYNVEFSYVGYIHQRIEMVDVNAQEKK